MSVSRKSHNTLFWQYKHLSCYYICILYSTWCCSYIYLCSKTKHNSSNSYSEVFPPSEWCLQLEGPTEGSDPLLKTTGSAAHKGNSNPVCVYVVCLGVAGNEWAAMNETKMNQFISFTGIPHLTPPPGVLSVKSSAQGKKHQHNTDNSEPTCIHSFRTGEGFKTSILPLTQLVRLSNRHTE